MVNRCGSCPEDTESVDVFWCSARCYYASFKPTAQAAYEYFLGVQDYTRADWIRTQYDLPSMM